MSFIAVLWALKQDLQPTQKLLLAALASHASRDDGSCFPKIRTLASEASVSARTVHRLLPKLVARGFVRVERKYSGKARLPHTYWLSCPLERKHSTGGGRTPYDARGRTENHYSNHYVVDRRERPGRRATKVRGEPTRDQKTEQAVQNELARRLGEDGWAILATFELEVPRLCVGLRNGTLTSQQLIELRTRYAAIVGRKK
jgi:hypothetical protein